MNAKSVSFGDVLSDKNRYIVPNNQRRYAWEKEQIGQFFKDVMYAYDQIKHETQFQYFFGPMVFIRDGDKQIVADGQQRLATANVFIAVIRDLLLDLNDGAESTNNHGLKYQHKKIISNITLGRHNKEFYNDYIIKQGSAKDKKDLLTKRKYQQKTDPNFWLAFAYCEFYDNLKKIMRSKIKEYVKLQSIVLDVFTIIKIDVNTTEYAYRIFETLNERGMPLAISDMIKNHVIECSKPKDRDLINTRWEEMIGVVGTKKINLYVRHFWIANYENVAKRELYKKISERMRKSKTGKKITNYVRDLHTQAEIFVALHDPIQYNSMWGRDSQIIDDLKMLNQLNSEVVKIVLLIAKAQKEKNHKAYRQLVHMMLLFFFRSKTIGNTHATVLEQTMAKIARNIRNSKKLDNGSIKTILKDSAVYPSDEEFKRKFVDKNLNTQTARYVLKQLEFHMGASPELGLRSPITVEHIMPKDRKHWSHIERDDHDDLLATIGNLALLTEKDNGIASSAPFKEKRKKVYIKSNIKVTKELEEYKKWNKETINHRAEKFAEMAIKIWKI